MTIVFVCEGCRPDIPQIGGLKRKTCILSQLWGLKAQVKASSGLVPSTAVRENQSHTSPPASGGLLAILGILWLTKASPPISAFPSLGVPLCGRLPVNISFL